MILAPSDEKPTIEGFEFAIEAALQGGVVSGPWGPELHRALEALASEPESPERLTEARSALADWIAAFPEQIG